MQLNPAQAIQKAPKSEIKLEDIFSGEILGKAKSVCRQLDIGGKFEKVTTEEKQKLIAKFLKHFKINIKDGLAFCVFLKNQFELKPNVVTLTTLLNNSKSQLNQETIDLITDFQTKTGMTDKPNVVTLTTLLNNSKSPLNQETIDLITDFQTKTGMTDKPNVVTLTTLLVNSVKAGDSIVKTKNINEGLKILVEAFETYKKMLLVKEFGLEENELLADGQFANILLGLLFRIVGCNFKNKTYIQVAIDFAFKLMNEGYFYKWKNIARDINTYMRTLIAFFNSEKVDDKMRHHTLNQMLMKIEFIFPNAKEIGIKSYQIHLKSLTDANGKVLDFTQVIADSILSVTESEEDRIKVGNSGRTFIEGLRPVNGAAHREFTGKGIK
jgi:hypothetical protein